VTEPSRAVFLSYASQDAEPAQKICDALRAAGIEVWFDKSELRGGDAWDQSIRRQIKNCALLIPVVSHYTHERAEGYFRLEWKLAVDRSHLIMANKAFLVPVSIDDTGDDDENVPDKFREVQWTRLPGGETPPAFVERIQRLLSSEAAPALERARPLGAATGSRQPPPRRQATRLIYAAITAAILLGLGYLGFERLKEPKPDTASAASIAVLPLANESGEASQQYFSDGISEDLITALSQFPGLKVIGRSSAFKFRDSREDSRSIGEKLGVAHLLEGSVRRSGNMVRVSAELIDAADGTTQWSERYDRPYNDLFALQDEITRSVAGALKPKLLPGEHASEQSDRPSSGNLEAYNALLQGRFYVARGSQADFRKAIEFFTQATELDPRYALAWTGLANCWDSLASGYLDGAQAQEAYAKARDAVGRALRISPDLAAAHISRGNLLRNADIDWRGSAEEYRRAIALAPGAGSAVYALGKQLAASGEVDQAIELTRQALTTDPLHASWYQWLAVYLAAVNRPEEAEHAIHRALELQPGAATFHYWLTVIQIRRGDAQGALTAAQQEVDEGWQRAAVALARQMGTDRIAADAALNTLIGKDAAAAPYQIAQVYALRGDTKNTFEWLDRSWSSRDAGLSGLLYDPIILRFKDDPRFAAFCRKVGLPALGEPRAHTQT
jgi:TolB-like protein/Tfp pilus assembly protein PilF